MPPAQLGAPLRERPYARFHPALSDPYGVGGGGSRKAVGFPQFRGSGVGCSNDLRFEAEIVTGRTARLPRIPQPVAPWWTGQRDQGLHRSSRGLDGSRFLRLLLCSLLLVCRVRANSRSTPSGMSENRSAPAALRRLTHAAGQGFKLRSRTVDGLRKRSEPLSGCSPRRASSFCRPRWNRQLHVSALPSRVLS